MLANYEVHEIVAQSAESVVFAGEEKQGGAPMAMRRYLVRRDGDRRAEDAAAFEAEIARVQGIKEARVVGILHGGFDAQDHNPYFVTRTVGGEPLPKVLNGSRLAANDAPQIVAEALEGLKFLHDRGLVHGGLRADRLSWSRERGVWLMDAGVEPALIKLGDYANAGAPSTTAPEFKKSPGRSVAGDFYALGASLFELLSGAPLPVDGGPRPSVGEGPLSRWDGWLEAMCAEDPAARPVDTAQAQQLLTKALEVEKPARALAASPAPAVRPVKPPARQSAAPNRPKAVIPAASVAAPVAAPAVARSAAPTSARSAAPIPARSATPQIAEKPSAANASATPPPTQAEKVAPLGNKKSSTMPWLIGAAVLGLGALAGVFFLATHLRRNDPPRTLATTPVALPQVDKAPPAPTKPVVVKPATKPAARPVAKSVAEPAANPVAEPSVGAPRTAMKRASVPAEHAAVAQYHVKNTEQIKKLKTLPNGEPANLAGEVKSIDLTGKDITISFTDVRARGFIKLDPAADPQAMVAELKRLFLNKEVNVYGTVERRGEKPDVRFRSTADITVGQ